MGLNRRFRLFGLANGHGPQERSEVRRTYLPGFEQGANAIRIGQYVRPRSTLGEMWTATKCF